MSTTISKAITAVYVGMYNRAADQDGYNWWLNNFGGNPDAQISAAQMQALAAGFASNPYFTSAYPTGMSDADFINQLYLNIGGNPGDSAGLNYWLDQLQASGGDRIGIVADFIHGFVSIDLNSKPAGLSDFEYQQAKERQDSLLNKISVSESFRDTLGSGTNLQESDPERFELDPAFQLSRSIIADVSFDDASVGNATARLAQIAQQGGNTGSSSGQPDNQVSVNGYDTDIMVDGQRDIVELHSDDHEFVVVDFEPELDRFALSSELRGLIGSIRYTGEVDTYAQLAAPDYFSGVAGQAAMVRETGKVYTDVDGTLMTSQQLIIDVDGNGTYNAGSDIAIDMPGIWQLEDYNFL